MTPKRVTCIYPFFRKLKWGFVCDVTKMHLFSDHFFFIFGMSSLKNWGLKDLHFAKRNVECSNGLLWEVSFLTRSLHFQINSVVKKLILLSFAYKKKAVFFLVILVTTKSRVGLVQKSSSFAMSITRMVVHTFMFYQKRL